MLTRRSGLRGNAATAAIGLLDTQGRAVAQDATPEASPVALSPVPLWQAAWERGIVYGTSLATWQVEDQDYPQVVDHEVAILFTEDDLLWWRLKPTSEAALDFRYGDRFLKIAGQQKQLVIGAHLVWDEGFGEGWTDSDL